MDSIREVPPLEKEKPSNIKQKTNTLTDHVSELMDSYSKLAVVTVTEKVTNAAAVSGVALLIFSLLVFALMLLSFGVAWWIGDQLQNILAGFSIVALFYIAMVGVVLLFKKKILFPAIRNAIIRKVYEQ